ncbi:hypothetical protein MmiEs2_06080 [Methanimicrococcus stummii]|uniref:DUF523 domain-containing protein n=1 Tax=Methanimicrococcus stummii TaxID=3028294 RepID=A0AA96V8Y1_9EURY|nr:hypothetical protein [Methanimicrococcus sp. Es2]WNY28423.1 hypothetical protein MmiEs2_06080 [Methanimicrococcus sp. Es2]
MMNQSKEKIYVIAHCLLNSKTRVKGIRRPDPFDTENKKIIQLPCPEFIFAGPNRERKTKEDYDTPEYRKLCRNLFYPYAYMIETLEKEGNEIIIAGVPKSPSCGILTTTVSGFKNNENEDAENEIVKGKGIFFEEIENELNKRKIQYLMTE